MVTALQVTAEARPEFVRPLREIVAEVARNRGLPDERVRDVKLCLSEAVTNSVQHAYNAGHEGIVEVSVRNVGDELEVVVVDQGTGFKPPSNPAGGFGLPLIDRLTDRCAVRRTGGGGTKVEMVFDVGGKKQPLGALPCPYPRDRRDPNRSGLIVPD
jgi:serine/threonine-protein kinase RsbW